MMWRRIQIWPRNALVCSFQGGHSMHCPEIGAACSQIDRGRQDRLVTVNSALPKASALDPQPVLGGVGDVSNRLYGILMIA